MQIRCGSIWKQLIASIANSPEDDFPGCPGADPEVSQVLASTGRRPAQTLGPVPRSSAPTGRWAFPATNRKTALPRLSAYSLPV